MPSPYPNASPRKHVTYTDGMDRGPASTPVQSRREVLERIGAHRAELQALGVATLWVFGSAARDELGPDSDIDVLVELSRPLGLEFMDISLHLEAWLGRPVDLGTPGSLHPRAQARAQREAIRAA